MSRLLEVSWLLACFLSGVAACEISDRTVVEQDDTEATTSAHGGVAGSSSTKAPTGAGSAGRPSSAGGTGSGGSAGSATHLPVEDGCETACIKATFNVAGPTGCAICHAGPSPLGGLDLMTASFGQRLKDMPARHLDTPLGACPSGDRLIDTRAWQNSWLLKKVKGEQGNCGTRMPAPPLPPADVVCIEAFVRCVAGQ